MRHGAGIEDVARRAGVSAATVSRALSGRGHVAAATRARVRAVAAELGYVASWSASALARGRTHDVGVVVPSLDRWFVGAVLDAVDVALREHGYRPVLSVLREGEHDALGVDVLRRRVDAIILLGIDLPERAGVPPVPLIGIAGEVADAPAFGPDQAKAVRMVTEHLERLGHRHIVGPAAHVALGRSGRAPSAVRAGHAFATRVLDVPRGRPTAIVGASDEWAVGAVLAARDLGLDVPRDVSVAGVDGSPAAEAFHLTTVERHPEATGRLAAGWLLWRLGATADAHPPDPSGPVPELLARGSTARPRRD